MGRLKENWHLILIGLATIVLAIIAVFTAMKLYKTGSQPIAPTAPKPAPAREPVETCRLVFTVGGITPTPTPSGQPTPTPTGRSTPTPTPTGGPTATPTPVLGCYLECDADSDCESNLRCQMISGTKRCVNPDCSDESDCTCNRNCWDVCGTDSECPRDLSCMQIGETKRCVKSACKLEQDCDCRPVVTTGTPTPTVYVAKVEMPQPGSTLPTLGAIFGGAALLITSLLLFL